MAITRHATDLFISTKIAEVTVVGANDVSREFRSSTSWVSSFGLSVILQNHPSVLPLGWAQASARGGSEADQSRAARCRGYSGAC